MAPRIFVAFDLETTGLSAKRDAIIEFGGVRFQEGRPRERFSTFVNPGRPLPLRIQQITGIRPADVADAPSIEEVIPEILAFIGKGTGAVVGHSAGFDISFLRAAGVEVDGPVLDTYEMATILLPGQESYSLGELCRSLEIPLTSAHRAGHDAEATADLLLHLIERIGAVPAAVLETLCAAGRGSDWGPMILFEDELLRRESIEKGERKKWRDWPEKSYQRAARPFTPGSSPQEIADDFLTEAFAEEGPLAAEFEVESGAGFEQRAGQLQMALQTLDALNRGDHRIIEAGTGTGKSLAYLLPAAAWAAANNSRVVIATNTIPLQDQLLEQEMPRVAQVLATADLGLDNDGLPPVQAMALKGRSRYLCTRRLASWLDAPRANGGLFT
jgi:DNA polymerase-3 subunit epsilon/ATP-dependent DNA helicase DinG